MAQGEVMHETGEMARAVTHKVERKGSDEQLVETGELRDAITHRVEE